MLLALPICMDEETATSMLMRAAFMNGWKNAHQLLNGCGANPCDKKLQIRKLPYYLECLKIESPMASNFLPISEPLKFRGLNCRIMENSIILPELLFREEAQAVCTACLRQGPYLKGVWSIKLFSTCTEHGVLFLKSCPQCQNELTWLRPAPELCICGFDLRLSETMQGNSLNAQYIEDLFKVGDQTKLNSISLKFNALSKLMPNEVSIHADEERIDIAVKSDQYFHQYLMNWVIQKLDYEHPRLCLLPLLQFDKGLNEIATNVLQAIDSDQLPIPISPLVPPNGKLTAGDARIVLGFQRSQRGVMTQASDFSILEALKKKSASNVFTRASIDLVLRQLWRPKSELTVAARRLPLFNKIPDLIIKLLSEPEMNAGYNLESGLRGLRAFPIMRTQKLSGKIDNLLDVNQASELLKVGVPKIYDLLKNGYLFTRKDVRGSKRKLFAEEDVLSFLKLFEFASYTANRLGITVFRIQNLARILDISFAGGPGIDRLKTFLLDRRDVLKIEKNYLTLEPKLLKNICPKVSKCPEHIQGLKAMTIAEVAHDLQLLNTDVIKLVRRGILEEIQSPQSKTLVLESSFIEFKKRFVNANMIEVHHAATMIGETIHEFRERWILTHIIDAVDLGIRQCIFEGDFKRIKIIKRSYITAIEASKEFNQGKYFLPNLEKRGFISSVRLGRCEKREKLRLYLRKHVEEAIKYLQESDTD